MPMPVIGLGGHQVFRTFLRGADERVPGICTKNAVMGRATGRSGRYASKDSVELREHPARGMRSRRRSVLTGNPVRDRVAPSPKRLLPN